MEEYEKCENCNGTGKEYVFDNNCTVYIGDCCGGCTVEVECEECNGTGEVINE